ncbi:Ada metal-binding domain-containing protein [Desulfitobacterium chlororespirans]|uniref:Metal binding domain of Ada n=1 Tax=Desulfitobacterium chlororespirans DSM 11544 TaxID=1121395 RepID=A0A1M7UBG7_9FIRM|nr:Ada metal-binding domain-containing protein [Desulfitobacterium chlororespirans]SHN80391.1 Metal binding domain of Ada [Desulfitobacterium chlororespirans DSM 11544]
MMKQYKLLDENGNLYLSSEPGQLGGYRRKKIYGRLDCQSANRAIAKGGYVRHRVFFKEEATAIKAGYRPCAKCMPEKYAEWKVSQG